MDALRTWLEVNHGAELPSAEDCTVLAGHAEATLAEAAAGVSTSLTPSGRAEVSSRWARGSGGASLVVGDLVGFLLPTLAKLSERLAAVLISDELGELENAALGIFRTIRAAAMIREHAKVLLSEKGAIRLVGEVMMRLLSKGASLRGSNPNCTSARGNPAPSLSLLVFRHPTVSSSHSTIQLLFYLCINSTAKIQQLGLRALSALALDPVVRRNAEWWEASEVETGGATAAIVEAMTAYDGDAEVQSA